MRDRADVRAKVSTKLRAMGWKPVAQGGNGKPIPAEQLLLASSLGWECEVSVTTHARNSGFPPCYKLDIACRELFIGIEIDGSSHRAADRRAQDLKKDAFLTARGWKIIRFPKERVVSELNACIKEVLSLI